MRSLALLLFCLPALTALRAQRPADLVLVHGKIWTENPGQPDTEAIAIQGNRIAATGSSVAMMKYAGPGTQIIQLHGRRVVPGFNDSHVHFVDGGAALAGVQLRDAGSQQEFRQRIEAFARTQPKGAWITNGEWDHTAWSPAVYPTHTLIDSVTPQNPVAVWRLDGHMLLANALAMQLAGINRHTRDVPGGVIVRDAQGDPTGIFKDAATGLITRVIPARNPAQIAAAVLAAQKYALANGVTSVQDLPGSTTDTTGPANLRVYQSLLRKGQLNVRISASIRLLDWQQLAQRGIISGFGNDMLHLGGLKSFADGGLGAGTAWMFEPYANAPANRGIASDELTQAAKMYADMQGGDRAHLQLITHAIGDRANHTILDMYERVEKADGPRDRRLRIEHAQHLLPSDIPRFAQLHVIASMQPYHAIDDGRWAENSLGAQRIRTSYAWRSLLDSGAVLAFGSDWPVAPMVPLMGIYAAVTRRTLDGKNPGGWVPAQKISVAQAVHAYTVGAAYAEFDENSKGSLEPGKLADLVVLSADIFHIDPAQIANTKVDLTILDGRVVYRRP
ncbi:MAG TPA: amidohydrolase [Acidobacteriaceae bacterium]|nr:amidohydrolase [Acidobacteriaceae bacterium]